MRKKSTLTKIEKEIRKERKDVESIEQEIDKLREKLLDRVPSHFSRRDAIVAFFGSLIIGLTFMLKGATIRTALVLNNFHMVAIIAFTSIILLLEIYFVSYVKVKDKENRSLGQFMAKRFFTLYFIAMLSSVLLVFLLGINLQTESMSHLVHVVVMTSMPCTIGATITTLLKKY